MDPDHNSSPEELKRYEFLLAKKDKIHLEYEDHMKGIKEKYEGPFEKSSSVQGDIEAMINLANYDSDLSAFHDYYDEF